MLQPILLAVVALATFVGTSSDAQGDTPEALLKSPEANFRAEGARRLAAQNTKKAVEPIIKAMQVEPDGAAGREMGMALKALTDADAILAVERHLGTPRQPGEFFAAAWALAGIAAGAHATGDTVLKNALKKTHKSEVSLRACALEAIGDSGRPELADWLPPMLREVSTTIDKGNMFETLSLLAAARKLGADRTPEARKPLLEGLIHVLDMAQDERIDYFAAHALGKLTSQPPYVDANWWRNYLLKGAPPEGSENQGEGKTIAKPTFFNTVAVGNRVLFVVDISGSMEWPADMKPKPGRGPETGRRKEGEDGPNYKNVKTKLDLAKVELNWTLSKLPEEMLFNIVVYETKHRLIEEITEGMVQATDANKQRFSALVLGLKANGGTNIHGSLTRALRMTRKKPIEGDPALDKRAMLEGADTIFFLTDGRPSWSDDSTGNGEIHPKWGAIGNGKFCRPEMILADISRVNTFRKVVIHTIGIGEDHDKELMEKLALQNHGSYVARG